MADDARLPRHVASEQMLLISGNDFIPAGVRLAWMRIEHPDATVETEMVHHGEAVTKTGQTTVVAIFRARIKTPSGGIGEGTGSETLADFNDYIEKAETKAVGRALEQLGYGVDYLQFAANVYGEEIPFGTEETKARTERRNRERYEANRAANAASSAQPDGKPVAKTPRAAWNDKINAADSASAWKALVTEAEAHTDPKELWYWLDLIDKARNPDMVNWIEDHAGRAGITDKQIENKAKHRRNALAASGTSGK